MFIVGLFLTPAVFTESVIPPLIADLGADQFRRRDRATALLSQMGVLAYPYLRRAATSRDPEVRCRALPLVQRIRLKALARAEERQVVLQGKEKAQRYAGTLLYATNRKAYILTTLAVVAICRDGITAEWNGEEKVARVEKTDEDVSLALLSIPVCKTLSPLAVAAGPSIGWLFDGQVDVTATFKEHMLLPRRSSSNYGAGVFAFDEVTFRMVLAGVNCGDLIALKGDRPHVPGPEAIRHFLGRSYPHR